MHIKKKRIASLFLGITLSLSAITGCATSGGSTSVGSPNTQNKTTESKATEEKTIWPKSSVQIVVPAKAGGLTDIHTRQVAKWWQDHLGQPLAVVNYDNGAVAYENVRTAKSDGSSLMMQHTGIAVQYVTGSIDYNPAEELSIIAQMQFVGDQAIIASANAPYNTFAEMIEYAKAHPGELSAGISFNGTTHLIWGNIMNETGAEFKLVEAANETDKLTNIAGGFISLGNVTLSNAKQYEESGMIKVLGILTADDSRNEQYPQWDPLVAQGYNVTWGSSFFLFGPKGLDADTIQAINASLKDITEDEEFVNAVKDMGGKAAWFNVEESQSNFAAEVEKIREVADMLGISAYE